MTESRHGSSLDDILALNEELRRRLDEAEDALRAIREGDVDAIVVSGSKGDRVFSLAETENLHRLMVEAMNEVGIAASPEGIILYCNRRASALLQRADGELLGRPLREFVAPQQAARIDALLQNPDSERAERLTFIPLDGAAIPMQVFASRVDASGGTVVCLVATDLTRVEADQALLSQLHDQQDALRAREIELTRATGRLAADLDAMSRLQRVAALFVRGEDMAVILQHMLDTAIAIAGAKAGNLQLLHPATGRPFIAAHRGSERWWLDYWEENLSRAPAVCGRSWDSGERVIVDDIETDAEFAGTDTLEIQRRAGVRAILSTPLVAPSGAVIGVLSTHFETPGRPDVRTLGWLDLLARETAEILVRSDTEASLRRRQEELEALFNESPAAILMAHDPGCTTITRNAEATRLLGDGPAAREMEKKLLQRAVVSCEPYRETEMEITSDAGPVFVTGGATPLFNASGEVRGAIAVFNNITAHRQVQEDLRKAVVRSDQLVRALEDAQRELKKSHFHLEEMVKERTLLSEERGEKLRVMANALSSAEQEERKRLAQLLHDDLQQMLVAIRLRLSNLESVVVGTSLGPTVSGINEIVDNAITASRSLTMELSPPILRESLPRAMEWLGQWFESRHRLQVEVSAEPDTREPSEEAKKFLFQAVRELLMNVRKHSGVERATLRIIAERDGVAIEVRDEGRGFDPANAAAPERSAFGLFSIRERVEMLGGKFEIQSTPGKGTACVIRVPVLERHAEAARHIAEKRAARKPETARHGPVRILVVDDHTIFRRGLISILESYPDLKVVGEASDGEEGVARATDLMPDVVIMDLAMPRMNGIEATRIIKSRFMSIDVLALSFQESDHARTSVLEAGASAYFTKSGPLDALLRAIRAHGNGHAPGETPEVSFQTKSAGVSAPTPPPDGSTVQAGAAAPDSGAVPSRSAPRTARRRRKA